MNYTVLIEKLAEKDIDDAFLWYELQKEGLGFEFVKMVNDSMQTIRTFPLIYPIFHKHLCIFVVSRFPYNIFYYSDREIINIIAVFHNKRNPDILLKRM